MWNLQGHDGKGHRDRERQASVEDSWGGENARRRVGLMAYASNVRAEFSRKGLDVDRDESDGCSWFCEGRVMDGKQMRGEDEGGAVEDGKFMRFREVICARRRGLCNVQCVA